MKKLTLTFAVLSTAAFASSAFADDNHGRGADDRAPIVDNRAPIADHRDSTGDYRGPIVDSRGPGMDNRREPGMDNRREPGMDNRRGPMIDHRFDAPPVMQPRWSLVSTARASGRRGMLTIPLGSMASYDQLKLITSQRGLAITSVELSYGRGRTVLVQPQQDGLVSFDLGRGTPRAISISYVNRGWGRDSTIQVLGKDDPAVAIGQHGRELPMRGGERQGWRGTDGFGRGGR